MRGLYLICNLISAALSSYFIMRSVLIFLRCKEKFIFKIMLYIGCAVLGHMIIFVGDLVNLPPTIIIFAVSVLFCCKGNFWQKITVSFLFISIALSLNALIDNYAYHYADKFPYRLAAYGLIYLFLYRLAPKDEFELSSSLWKLLFLLTLTPVGVILSIILFSSEVYGRLYEGWLSGVYFVLLCIAFLSNIGLMWTAVILFRHTKLEQRESLMELNLRYYENMERQQFEVRRLKHDMRNHLHTALALSQEEKDEYLNELLNNAAFSQKFHYCADATVNAVLSQKSVLMEMHGISFHAEADVTKELPFEKPDICAMLANALDNAIEACCFFPRNERRIELELREQKGLFVMKMSNRSPYSDTRGSWETTKKDAKEHGYGIRSIQEVINRYGGTLELKNESGMFWLLLYIPMPASS